MLIYFVPELNPIKRSQIPGLSDRVNSAFTDRSCVLCLLTAEITYRRHKQTEDRAEMQAINWISYTD